MCSSNWDVVRNRLDFSRVILSDEEEVLMMGNDSFDTNLSQMNHNAICLWSLRRIFIYRSKATTQEDKCGRSLFSLIMAGWPQDVERPAVGTRNTTGGSIC